MGEVHKRCMMDEESHKARHSKHTKKQLRIRPDYFRGVLTHPVRGRIQPTNEAGLYMRRAVRDAF